MTTLLKLHSWQSSILGTGVGVLLELSNKCIQAY